MARIRQIQQTLAVILLLNALVVAIKALIAWRTGNLTVLGATLESALDASNNVLAMVVVSLAARGPDEDHPYGHDKFETMGAVAIVGFLSISCFELLRGAVDRLLHPSPLPAPDATVLALLGGTALVNIGVVLYERRAARRLSSPLLLADASHTLGDLFVTGLAFVSLATARAGPAWLDPALTIVVASVVAWSGLQILRLTVPVLVDQRGADAERIREAACRVRGVSSAPRIRSRTAASGTVFVEVTITVAGATSVANAHGIADAVEQSISAALDGAIDVVVHVEPA